MTQPMLECGRLVIAGGGNRLVAEGVASERDAGTIAIALQCARVDEGALVLRGYRVLVTTDKQNGRLLAFYYQ